MNSPIPLTVKWNDLLFLLYEEDDEVDESAEEGQGHDGHRHDGHRQGVDRLVVKTLTITWEYVHRAGFPVVSRPKFGHPAPSSEF